MTERLQEILNRKPSKWGNLTVKEFERDIKLLQERVQELEEFNRILSSDKSMFIEELVREQHQNKRYKQALELVEDELEYAKTTGNDEVRDIYIKNSIRFINEALEGEG